MTDYTDPQHFSQRLSDRDRAEALDRLAAARDEGRLRPDEFDSRASAARMAVTRGDLRSIFSDLSAPSGFSDETTTSTRPSPPFSGTLPTPVGTPGARGGALGGTAGVTVVALAPFIALVLFFLFGFAGGWTWSWVFFLLIPVAGIVVYGPGARYRR